MPTTPALHLVGTSDNQQRPQTRAGAEVLDDVATFLSRFLVLPSEHCAPTIALWFAHTHAAHLFYATPRLILDSAEPGSGKTRVLEVGQYLVREPEMTISATTAALFRMVSAGPITILFDEVDAIFNPKNGGNYEDLRAMLNAGYKRSATIARCVGDAKAMKVERFPVYAPAALAGIAGHMPATITTRAITIHMRKRAPDEPVEEFLEEDVEGEAAPLREELAAWTEQASERLAGARPAMPAGVFDRSAEIWKPLIALADHAGGHWPDTARAACQHFVHATGGGTQSLGVRLLADLRDLFTARGVDRMTTVDILPALHGLDEAPWGDLYGKPLDPRRLSKELARYGVASKNIKQPGGHVAKGFRTDGEDGLVDAWRRYLPSAATSATDATAQVTPVADDEQVPLPALPDAEAGSGGSGSGNSSATALTRQVAPVAAVADNTSQPRTENPP
ncbi:DUF3631 domain-containing protein [Allosaccharopolyspora coralli]|uniref:DUF3631 domain-containing protein n=1 Tax=Allosaccharopolyspora coralli TaxID=2665642 RepID=A0A5Q3QAW2_9PSEU|nr:DUF3631 domain-containing protein [Allosaccharopolyspora coralli]QGK71612.1 DUF3631 domain-containing protein [Allosaccharopolyspora coralli]